MQKAVLFLAACLGATSVSAQQPAPPASVDMAGFVKAQHQTIRKNLLASAEKMPEADFHFKPQGTAPEVRTFGQIIAHVANGNYGFCSQAKGEKSPAAPLDDLKEQKRKAELVKALTEAFAYCDPVYAEATSASMSEMMKRPGPNNTTLERARGNSLIFNVVHNNEHYGNLVTYLRARGLVPPSSER